MPKLKPEEVEHRRQEIVDAARRSALALYTWTVDSSREIERLIDLGVDGICTNYPDKAVKLLETPLA